MSQQAKQRSSLMQPIIVGVVLALLVGSSSPWWWDEVFSAGGSDTSTVPASPVITGGGSDTDAGGATGGSSDEPSGSPGGDDISPTSSNGSGCEIVIENPLVTLYEDTDTFGLEAGRAAPGTYAVQETRTVTFAGNPQRWFRITSGGVTGWLQDSSILIAAKSGPCT